MIPKPERFGSSRRHARCLRRAAGADHGAARREAGTNSVAGGRGSQHPLIAEEVGVQPRIVSNWRRRFAEHGIGGFEGPATGRQEADLRQGHEQAHCARWISRRLRATPDGRVRCWPRHWATLMFSMSGASCASDTSTLPPASRGARATTLRSWQSRRCGRALCRSPVKAIVLCVAEKPSIQALERAQGYLKLPNGRALTGQNHDYKRHGTTTLFAALEVATGRIIAAHSKRRRRVEFLGFMNSVVAAFPGCGELHVILDNLNTHKRTSAGSRNIPLSISISPRPDRHGSIRSKRGFQFSRASR